PKFVLFEISSLQAADLAGIDANLKKEGYVLLENLVHQDKIGLTMPPQDALYGLKHTQAAQDALATRRTSKSLPLTLEDGHVPLFVKWEKYLGKDLSGVNFVQIGGNCGTNLPECAVGGDPIWEYATRFDWNGIVLEPVPQIFSKLSSNYLPYPTVKPVQALVSNHSGIGKILDRAETSHEISLSRSKGVEVPTYTLETLWKDVFGADKDKVDLLVVDAEGNEPKILSGKFPEPKPKFVLFEISSLQAADLAGIDANLKKEGYVLLENLVHQDKIGLTMPPQDALYGLKHTQAAQDSLAARRTSKSLPLTLEDGHVPLFVKWEKYLGKDLSGVNFVQIGGNCGTNLPECAVGGDPIWEYATRFDWNGIVLEPVPQIFSKLSSNYLPYPTVKPVQALVSNHSGIGKILDRAETSHEISLSRSKGVEVPTYTLETLWKDVFGADKDKVDLLVVDAEGNEPKILSGKFPEPKPKFVLFEISSLQAADLAGIDANLKKEGYVLLENLVHQDKIGLTMPPQDALYGLQHTQAAQDSLAARRTSKSLPLTLEDGHVPLFVKWEKYLGKDLSGVNFVQIGGNCGTNLPECAVGGDPIWEYATRFDWNGIVLEPVPQIFSKLSRNYLPYPTVKPVQALVSNHSGIGKILDRAETSHEISLSRSKGVEVPTYTLETLWKDVFGADKDKVDLLVVDAEGNEPKILSGKFPEPKPKFVLFEISSLQAADLAGIDANLKKEGYVLLESLVHQDKIGLTMPPQDALYGLQHTQAAQDSLAARRTKQSLPLALEDGHVPLFVKWEEYLHSMHGVNFVQIGGNCGTNLPECAVGGDPIWEYATRFDWNGIVLEPVPQIFSKLSRNYLPYPTVKPVQALVSNHTGIGKILDRAETSHEISLSRNKGVEVPTYTLETLWKDVFGADKDKVDLLVVDAEGNEPKILSGKFPQPKPKFVLFEISSLQQEDLDSIDSNLKKEGYVLAKKLKHQDKIGLTMPPQDALYYLRPDQA
ncbi:unnamed protein product, partial [Prorocentrum cordatum]